MDQCDWLVNSYEPCVAGLTAVLYRRGLAPDRARDLAEDSVQEAIVAALRTGQVFESEAHCRNWIFRAAFNHAIEVLRSEERRRQLLAEHAEELAEGLVIDPHPRAPEGPWIDCLREVLRNLPKDDQALVDLRYFRGLGLKALIGQFGLKNLTAVWRRFPAILKRLRDLLKARWEEEE